eukprot:Colp12_sorted_trinity150504_noHs@18512
MFKKFTAKESVSSTSQVKSSVQRSIRADVIKQFPNIEEYIEDIMPKKTPVIVAKCQDHINLITVNKDILFFQEREGPYYPTLRLLHKYPNILPHQQVDKGAIRFILSGANIMCPGLTSPGAKLEPAAENTIVAVMAEGKQHAVAIGLMKMSSEEILKTNKGIGIDTIHFLNDGLWGMKQLE